MTKLLFGSVALLLSAGAAYAEETPPKPESEQIVCKSQRDLESRIPKKKICKTRAEWAEQARASQEDVRKNSNNRTWVGANGAN